MKSKAPRKQALDRLSASQKAMVAEHASSHTPTQTRRWLARPSKLRKAGGMPEIKISLGDLDQWLFLHRLGRVMRENAATVEAMVHGLRRIKPDWTEEDLQAAGQFFFSAMAVRVKDPRIWVMIQRLALQRDQLAFSRERFKEQLRSKLALGLDAVARAFLNHPAAMDLYRQARALIQEALPPSAPEDAA